jgi:hypothetical protein
LDVNRSADIRIGTIERDGSGTRFEFWDGEDSAKVSLPYLLPDYFGYTLAAALCINADEGNTIRRWLQSTDETFSFGAGKDVGV